MRLSKWGPAKEYSEPGQVGNQAALNCSFFVPDSISEDAFFFLLWYNPRKIA